MRAERTRYPLDDAVLFNECTLRVEIHHVARPVLNRRIAQARAFLDEELDTAGMQVRDIVFRSRAALDEMQAGIFLNDDQRVLELTGTCRMRRKYDCSGISTCTPSGT